MAVNEHELCMGCMSLRNGEGRCKHCGYDPSTSANVNFLPPGRKLNHRYLVGKLVTTDPEGAWYVGYDMEREVRIWVREYAPASITRRDYRDFSVQPLANAEAQFKALLSDFEELCSVVMKLSSTNNVLPVQELVYENRTVYAIYSYIKTITLESFLSRSGGKLSWRHAKKLLMPLYHTVVNLHKAGLIHRGLSSATVLLDQAGTLWLTGFSIAAARTNKSELSAQLFPGYSAPEQYSLNSWQGTWTDVYALGAITYRVVTGLTPPPALDRIYGDDLLDSRMVSGEMTGTVVEILNRALAVEVEDRIQTAETFIAGLLANEGSNTAVYEAPIPRRALAESMQAVGSVIGQSSNSIRDDQNVRGGIELLSSNDQSNRTRRPQEDTGRGKRRRKKKSHPVLSLMLSLLIATGLLAGAMYWITNTYLSDLMVPSDNSSTSSFAQDGKENALYTDSEDETLIPKLVGKTAESVQSNTDLTTRFQFDVIEQYNSDYDKGVVFDQQPVEGVPVDGIDQITIYVSKGMEQIELPDLTDWPIAEATAKLTDLGLQFTVIPVFNNDYEPGVIISTDPEAGALVNKTDGTVLLKIKKEVITEDSESEEDRDDKSSSSKKSKSSKSKDTESRLIRDQ